MNRTDGLVRRVKRTGDSSSDANNSQQGNSIEENDNNQERDEEMNDNDSKETRLTLMEEVLLLGLKDKEVYYGLLRDFVFCQLLVHFY